MKTKLILFVTFLLAPFLLSCQERDTFFDEADAFFRTYVTNGLVNYKSLKNDSSSLDKLLRMASLYQVSNDNERIYQAFWINAYNLAVIKGVVDHYPVTSPLDVSGFFDKQTYSLASNEVTLNEIEHQLLRAKFPQEARFHFVLVCAGLGCPPLINKAYFPSTLENQLQEQTKMALNDSNFIRSEEDRILLSQIFEWFKEDFVRVANTELSFINMFRNSKLNETLPIGYYKYDWRLNELK